MNAGFAISVGGLFCCEDLTARVFWLDGDVRRVDLQAGAGLTIGSQDN